MSRATDEADRTVRDLEHLIAQAKVVIRHAHDLSKRAHSAPATVDGWPAGGQEGSGGRGGVARPTEAAALAHEPNEDGTPAPRPEIDHVEIAWAAVQNLRAATRAANVAVNHIEAAYRGRPDPAMICPACGLELRGGRQRNGKHEACDARERRRSA
jgi:hypothetical protein